MESYLKYNMENWDERVELHTESAQNSFYDIEGFINGETTLKSIETEEVGNVQGKDLLHLQCHFGLDTLSWARKGARITGVDFSEKAIDYARNLARKTQLNATFICTDILTLPRHLNKKFDIVFASYGVFCWIESVSQWINIAARFLKPNGILFVIDNHPLIDMYEYRNGKPEISYSYFEARPIVNEIENSYVESSRTLQNTKTYEWNHELSVYINAVINNGLKMISLKEYPFGFWQKFGNMEQNAKGWWELKNMPVKLPLMFSLKARRQP